MRLPLVLASASPRRARLLRDLGLEFLVVPTDVDERPIPGETAAAQVTRLASLKAARGLEAIRLRESSGLVLAADTVVVLGDEILGKPANEDEALRALLLLSGRTHEVVTALRLVRSTDGAFASAVDVSRVRFRSFDASVARRYVETREPMDKAGAYGLQGRGALLSDGIDGSWSNVVGLPLERLPSLFESVGDDVWARISDAARPS